MKELLSLLPRPSHYIGTEEGSVHKEPASVRLHCALAFPDLYEVGMSYLGHKILYTILNNREDIFAERVYAPCRETGRLLREHGVSLATLESDTDIVKTHMFAFAITHELCFTNVLYMLELSGIPLRAADRGDDLFRWPLIVAGGGCAIASEPLAPFMDLMLLGEGEEMVPELCDLVIKAREEGWSRSRLIEEAVNIPGVYAPSLYTHDANGVLTPLKPDLPTPGRRIVADFDRAKGMSVMENILQANPEIDGLYAANDEMLLGALEAMEAAGRTDEIVKIGCDAIDDTLDAMKAGKVDATIAEPPFFLGKAILNTAYDYLEGKQVEPYVILDNQLVTQDTVDSLVTKE